MVSGASPANLVITWIKSVVSATRWSIEGHSCYPDESSKRTDERVVKCAIRLCNGGGMTVTAQYKISFFARKSNFEAKMKREETQERATDVGPVKHKEKKTPRIAQAEVRPNVCQLHPCPVGRHVIHVKTHVVTKSCFFPGPAFFNAR